jgi:large subunit ribosomal protein L24
MEVGKAKIAGFDARNIAARLKLDAGGLAIERLSVGDLGDTSFVATGRIQTLPSPGGSITVNLDARDLNGILALSEKFTPALAGPLRRLAARQKTATLQANLSMATSGADGASGKIGLIGKVGAIRVNVSASATGKREAFMVTDLSGLAGADVRGRGRRQLGAAGRVSQRAAWPRIAVRRQARRRTDRCRRQGHAAVCSRPAGDARFRSVRRRNRWQQGTGPGDTAF